MLKQHAIVSLGQLAGRSICAGNSGTCRLYAANNKLMDYRATEPQVKYTGPVSFETLQAYAAANGFELLDEQWGGSEKKYQFKHIETGKSYEGKIKYLRAQGFPRDLRSPVDKLNALRAHAAQNGFELLEKEWLGIANKHKFKHIEKGSIHAWQPVVIMSKLGFPSGFCSDLDRFTKLSNHSKNYGFELIETEWLGVNVKHRFKHVKCGSLHEWTPSQVRKGFPRVNGQRYVTEEICRQAMAHIFGGTFKSDLYRLKSIHGKNMELDGLECFLESSKTLEAANAALGTNSTEVAFEFQGHPAHYENHSVMHRDHLRVKYCQGLGILLVVIEPPDNWKRIRDSEYMFEHVCKAVRRSGNLPEHYVFKPAFSIDLSTWNPDLDNYKDLKQLADQKGYILIEKKWLGAKVKHRFFSYGKSTILRRGARGTSSAWFSKKKCPSL